MAFPDIRPQESIGTAQTTANSKKLLSLSLAKIIPDFAIPVKCANVKKDLHTTSRNCTQAATMSYGQCYLVRVSRLS